MYPSAYPLLSAFAMSSKLQSDVRSGECLRGEVLVRLIVAVVCSLAAAAGPTVR